MEKLELVDRGWECKMVQLLWERVWQFLKMLNGELPYDPASPHKRTESKDSRRYVYTHVHISIFHNSPKLEATQVTIDR